MSRSLDRRRFLLGAGGAMLALPMLQAFAPRSALGKPAAPPKRLVIVHSANGRVVGNGKVDRWSPGQHSKSLSDGSLSQILAPLSAVRDEIVTFDGIDNVVRHGSGDVDGHTIPVYTALTGLLPAGDKEAAGPSVDYIAGLRLRSGPAMWPCVVIPASATPEGQYFQDNCFYGDAGTAPRTVSGNPATAIGELFGAAVPDDNEPPPVPTLRERLAKSRRSLLDGVLGEFKGLRGRVNASDREKLDRHAEYIRTLERAFGPVTRQPAKSCKRPNEADVPYVMPSTWDEFLETGRNPLWERGTQDDISVPYQVENLVQTLACDITRVGSLSLQADPSYAFLFPNGTPFSSADSFHGSVHGLAGFDASSHYSAEQEKVADSCAKGARFNAETFALLVKRLGEIEDTDGSRLLDNTLVVWFSELGYGSTHACFNIPIVMAGMGDAFAKGRHIVEKRRTTGDLWAHVLRLLGGDDTTFGEKGGASGTVGELAQQAGVAELYPEFGAPGYIHGDTPLHRGPLSL